MPKRIVIAAGGTAGHVVPALAVAQALAAEGAQVTWVGGERAEATLVPAAGYELVPIRVEGLSRTNPLKAARSALKALGALRTAFAILARVRPDAVLGGGGYVAGPVGLAAVLRRVPIVLTEADSHLGVTNRALARFARRVCLAFPLADRTGDRYRVTGRPVPPPQLDRVAARKHFGVPDDQDCVVVFGGSLGARSINQASLAAFADAPFHVIHATGSRDFSGLSAPNPRYDLREYLDSQEFSLALAAADIVVARAGGSIFEVAAHGRPAVLVPYPHAAADHQSTNAHWMADAGAALVISDSELTSARLARTIGGLFADRPRLAAMANASAALARPHAAADVAAEVLAAAGDGSRR